MVKYYEQDNVVIRQAVISDVLIMKDKLRQEDIDEIWASHHHLPEEALRLSLEESVMAFTVEYKNEPIVMFGIVPVSIFGNSATIWMLSTDKIEKIRLRFLRNNKKFIDFMLGYYGNLFNFVSVKNMKSLQWLRWLGANFRAPCRYGIEQELFQYFWFERK